MKGCFRKIGLLLLLTTTIILDSTNALTIVIPDKLRLNQHTGQPRTCSVIGGALHIMTRVALLGGSSSDKFQMKVKVKAVKATKAPIAEAVRVKAMKAEAKKSK